MSKARNAPQGGKRRLQFETLESRELLAADLIISEFLASNDTGLKDGDNDSSDWIELYNNTAAPIDLAGYHLTDDEAELDKWSFPIGTTINAGSTLLVFASNKADAPPIDELHTNFKLSAGGEYLGLIAPDGTTVLDEFYPEFPEQLTDISYGVSMTSTLDTLVDEDTPMRYRVPSNSSQDATWKGISFNDSPWSLGTAGLGYENNSGYEGLIDSLVPNTTLSAYTRFEFNLADPSSINTLSLQMMYDDGFVAYLNGQLIASENAPANPAYNSIAEGDFRSDELILSEFVEFDVSAFTDLLVAGNNVLAIHALNLDDSSDMLMIPRLLGGSGALTEPLQYGHFETPSPDAPNGQVFAGVVADTSFSIDRGFYDAPISVEITSETASAMIVYTTDGSAPTVNGSLVVTNGAVYSEALSISQTTTLRAAAFKSNFISTNVDTQTYVFLDDVIQQTYASIIGDGFPSSWGSRQADYGLDPDVIGPNDLFDGVYAAQIKDSLLAIPTISLVLDNDDFFGPDGIYSNPTNQGVAWEVPTSAELIYPDGSQGFQIDAGMRVAGAASRTLSDKNGLRLLFKSEYGATKLEFPLFGEGVDKFDTVVLRPHFNDGWGWDGALGDPLYARDQWFRDTQIAMGHESTRGNLAHLYVNGVYWGLYNPSERPDASYQEEHFGGQKEDYDVMVSDGVHDGNDQAYNTAISMALDVITSSGSAAQNAAYQLLQGNTPTGENDPSAEDFLDVVNYIDYMLLNHYGGNDDWPNRNWYAGRLRGAESEGFKFFAWDSEISLDLSSRTSLTEDYTTQSTGAAQFYAILDGYEEFRLQFADRIHQHLFNGGALYVNPDNAQYDPAHPEDNVPAARFAGLAEQVRDAMVAESARWGDQHVSLPRTRDDDWQPQLDYMLETYFTQRHDIVLNQWENRGLYPSTDAPELVINGSRQHGGTIDAGDLLSFENSNSGQTGTIYYTTDGSDPRLVGGAINTGSAQVASGSTALGDTTHLKARILLDGVWSALTESTFVVPTADFDSNNLVDGFDFLTWQRGFGSESPTLADGDADQDGDVDGDDLAVLQSQAGTSPAPIAAAPIVVGSPALADNSTVPAPTSPALATFGAQPLLVTPDPTSTLTSQAAPSFSNANHESSELSALTYALLDSLQQQDDDTITGESSAFDEKSSEEIDTLSSDEVFTQWDGVSTRQLAYREVSSRSQGS